LGVGAGVHDLPRGGLSAALMSPPFEVTVTAMFSGVDGLCSM
jgi:hypothetical protein